MHKRPIDKAHVGQVVVLRSGGPQMTVVRLADSEDGKTQGATCAWHSGEDGPVQERWFPVVCLDEITDEEETL